MTEFMQSAMKWLAATGTGVAITAIAYITDALGMIAVDLSATEGLVLAAVITGATKFLGWVVGKIQVE